MSENHTRTPAQSARDSAIEECARVAGSYSPSPWDVEEMRSGIVKAIRALASRPPAAPVEFDTLAGARKQAMKDHASMLPAAPVETDRDPLMGLVASLAAAISLLERTPKSKKAAPSDKMFDQMLTDYRKALEAGRDFVRTYRDAYEHGYNDGVEWAQTHPQSSADSAKDNHHKENVMLTEAQIKYLVDRFLMWKLPEDFNPDGGVSFTKLGNAGTPYQYTREPVGTNLLSAIQADAMVRHMIEGMPEL